MGKLRRGGAPPDRPGQLQGLRYGEPLLSYCWGVLLLGNMVFHYGILPSAVVLVIWAVLSVSYTREAIRLGRRGQKTE